MGSVTSYTKVKIDSLIAMLVTSAAIAGDGTLTVTLQNGDVVTVGTVQQLNDALTAIAGLSPAADDLLQFKSGNWVNRTMAELSSDLIDTTASDIKPNGPIAAAGSSGKIPDASHVHAGLSKVAATATGGYTLINGTGDIITWTTPNDGQPHFALIGGSEHITSNLTGGNINAVWTNPDSSATPSVGIGAGGVAAGERPLLTQMAVCAPNTLVKIIQNTAVTGGGGKLHGWIAAI